METESSAIAMTFYLNQNNLIIIKIFIMKNVKFSLIIALTILGASVTAFTSKTSITPGWYGQTTDAVPPYDLSNPITTTQLDTKCPSASQHICAVQLDMNGNLVATRKSVNNFRP
jgi:hypothetical protein